MSSRSDRLAPTSSLMGRPRWGVMPEFVLQTLSGPIANESATRVVPWKQMCAELAALGIAVDGTPFPPTTSFKVDDTTFTTAAPLSWEKVQEAQAAIKARQDADDRLDPTVCALGKWREEEALAAEARAYKERWRKAGY